jgi:hypothetical protein
VAERRLVMNVGWIVLEAKSHRYDFMDEKEIAEVQKQEFELLVFKDETSRIQEQFDKRERGE